MVVLGYNIYQVMVLYALSEGLNYLQAKHYANSYFDYWYIDKSLNVNVYGKFDSKSSEACK